MIPPCTPFDAPRCLKCGKCKCIRGERGNFLRSLVDGRVMYSPLCPLHAPTSRHAKNQIVKPTNRTNSKKEKVKK